MAGPDYSRVDSSSLVRRLLGGGGNTVCRALSLTTVEAAPSQHWLHTEGPCSSWAVVPAGGWGQEGGSGTAACDAAAAAEAGAVAVEAVTHSSSSSRSSSSSSNRSRSCDSGRCSKQEEGAAVCSSRALQVAHTSAFHLNLQHLHKYTGMFQLHSSRVSSPQPISSAY
jgi:hypothetical protein